MSVISGLVLDMVYGMTGVSAQATVGQASEIIPMPVKLAGVVVLGVISIKPLLNNMRVLFGKGSGAGEPVAVSDCCSGSTCSTE